MSALERRPRHPVSPLSLGRGQNYGYRMIPTVMPHSFLGVTNAPATLSTTNLP